MKELQLLDLAREIKGTILNNNSDVTVKGISTDSRKVSEGDLFIAISGERMDGHDFISQAVEKGCSAVVVHKDIKSPIDRPVIRVEDTLKALHQMAEYYISMFDIPKIAVTGSTGKTTTKEIIFEVLSKKYQVVKNIGNYNNHIGLPLSVFNIEKKHEIAVFEMGMSDLGEIDLLASIIKPDVAVITNIGLSHIERLKSQKNILKAKLEVTNYFTNKNILIINNDDVLLKTFAKESKGYKLVKIGFNKNSDLIISQINHRGDEGIIFSLDKENHSYNFQMKVMGNHNVYNAAMAIAVGIQYQVDMNDIIEAISQFKGFDMRLNVEKSHNGVKILNDAYNASPDSMKAAIQTLTSIKGQRHIAILSDMLEMGAFAEKYHKEVGDYTANAELDMLIAVGDTAEYIAIGAKASAKNMIILHFSDKNELLKNLDELIMPGDVVLVKGSRGMRMEEIVHYILERG